MHANGVSTTVVMKMLTSRLEQLVLALDQEIPLMPFPPDFKRGHDADQGGDIILDYALAGCILLLRELSYQKPLDRIQYFLGLRTLVRQLIALRMWEYALKLSGTVVSLLRDFRISFHNEFVLDLIIAHATHAVLLGANSRFLDAKASCEEALTLTKQLGKGAKTHPVHPLILRIAAYFVVDIPPRLNYLLEAVQYYRSTSPPPSVSYMLPFAETLSSLGRCYLKQQEPLMAIGVLREAEGMFHRIQSTPSEHLIICLIRLGQAFQANGQLSNANEILERAHIALQSANLQDGNPLRNQLVRVRQGYRIPSSVSTETDPIVFLPSVYQVDINVNDNCMSFHQFLPCYFRH
jgi:tetratricopeptide (TPR) repeat protein